MEAVPGTDFAHVDISKVKTMFPTMKNTCDKMGLYVATHVEKEFEAKEVE